MNLHPDDNDSFVPCKHMESMLNQTADGTASPLVRWYANLHAKGCGRCGRFLHHVTHLLRRLKETKNLAPSSIPDRLSDEKWEGIEAKWSEAERRYR